MKIKNLGLYTAGLMALAATTPASLFSATVAGTDVLNTATVSYEVDDVPQPDEEGGVTFKVDVLINPTVANASGVTVTADEEDVVLEFTVTNDGNDIQDFVLGIEQGTGDDGDLENLAVYIDDGDGIFEDDGSDTLVDLGTPTNTPIHNQDPDDVTTVFVVGNIPDADGGDAVGNGDEINIDLIATAYDPATTTTIGAIEAETPEGSATQAGEDTIFGDAAGTATGDADEDGVHSDEGTFTVGTVSISVVKTATVIDNGLDEDSDDQFYIPGAIVEYTITVSYTGSAAATAGSITMSDPVPANTTYVASSITLNAGAITDVDTDSDGDFDAGAGADGTVTVNIPDRAGDAGDDVIKFRVTID